MYTQSQSLSQLCEQRENMLSQLRRKRRENMLEQKRNFENIYSSNISETVKSLNILEMAEELNEDKAFYNFTNYIQIYEESSKNCSALIKFNDNYYHYFTALDYKDITIEEVIDNNLKTMYQKSLTEYLQNISTKPFEYMLIHYIGKYIKFTNFDSFVRHLNSFYKRIIERDEIYAKISQEFSTGDCQEYVDIRDLLYFIDWESNNLGLKTRDRHYKNLGIINYSGNHNINLNIYNLNDNYKINIINNLLLLRFGKDTELTEFILKFGDIINDKKNHTFLTFIDAHFKIHNTDELINVNQYLNDYYISYEDYQMLIEYNQYKRNPNRTKDCDLDSYEI